MTNSTNVALILTATDKASAIVNSLAGNATKKLSGLAGFGRKLGDMGPKMMVVGDAVTGFFKSAVKDAQGAEEAFLRMQHSLEILGDKKDKFGKGIVAQEFAKFANQIELDTGIQEEVVQQVQANMSLYKSVISKTSRDSGLFNKAVAYSIDMQAKGLGDATGNAKLLGRALEDPLKGISKLNRAGIVFSETEQKKIKSLVETGQKAKAQQIIIDAVGKKVGGTAKAIADPIDLMNARFADAKKEMGKGLLPVVQGFSTKMMEAIPPIMDFIQANPALIKSIAGIGVSLLVVGKTITIVSALASGSGIGLIFMGIAAAAALIISNWEGISKWFKGLWDGVTKVFSGAWNFIKSIFLNATPAGLIYKHWDKISGFFKGLWNGAKLIFSKAWDGIKSLLLNYTPQGLIFKNWGKISTFFMDMWGNVKLIFTGVVDWFKGLGGDFLKAGENIIGSIWKGITNKAQILIDGVKGIVKKVRDFFPFSPAKDGPLKDIHKVRLIETIASGINAKPLLDSIRGVTGKVANFMPNFPMMQPQKQMQVQAQRSNGGGTMTFNINVTGAATEKDGKSIAAEIKKMLPPAMKQYEAQKQRISLG